MRIQSWQEHVERDEQIDRRLEAMARHRQQLDFGADEVYPICPNCSGYGEPVYMPDQDLSVGYVGDGVCCKLCVEAIV